MRSGCQTAAIIGAGIAGIATAYYLSREQKIGRISLIDTGQPMAFTSAQSGENYRNWWPHPTMTAFTDLSIDLMEDLARECGNRFALTRRGYALATRRVEIGDVIETLFSGYSSDPDGLIRVHDTSGGKSYRPPTSAEWEGAPDGVDVIMSTDLIRKTFPNFSDDIRAVVHIRRAGDISGQQLGQYMLDQTRDQGLERVRGTVCGLECSNGFCIHVDDGGERRTVETDIVVNAAGPLVNEVGSMLDYTLPVRNVLEFVSGLVDVAQTSIL